MSSKNNFRSLLSLFLPVFLSLLFTSGFAQTPKNSDAKAAVQTFFSLLKTQNYSALYDYLPSEMQQRLSRQQLTNSLKRLNGFISIEKMDIGRVQQKGDFAVIDTTIYGKLIAPPKKTDERSEAKEGKVAVQQYLFKENGHWKVATSDSSTRNVFLKNHPDFKKDFQFTQPKLFIKQDGKWTSLN